MIANFADAGKMTEAEYRHKREAIRTAFGDTATERTGIFDRILARLFYESGWTQEELAAVENKSRIWIAVRLRFGRFLNFVTAVTIPTNLTEGRFRQYWERTDKDENNERIRFAQVVRLMAEQTTLSKPHSHKTPIAEAIKATSADGTRHKLATIVNNVQAVVKEATEDEVKAVLSGMVAHGWYHVFCEKKKGVDQYRIVIGGKNKIDLVAFKQEVGPILEGLKAEGRKNMATMSPGTVAHLAFKLEKLIDKLAHLAPDSGADSKE